MLKLVDVRKEYVTGAERVEALKGVSVCFRKNEFVSVLGPSGCGKTTLLNLIGGLDRYTTGDIQISGRSTKEFKDRDWDSYRNNTIGFVFQSYNLIPHQTVLQNVELSLTLTGVSKAERRRRALEVLNKVGLGDQVNKRPGQMSGGQMQRVAIARALINDPEILLADEPTGALDSETGIQVMELLKEIAEDRLVIMVTHNPDLAKEYSTRIIRLLDGRIVDDTMPYDGEDIQPEPDKSKRPSMSLRTALSLSLKNLLTKKARTILISFAGSIGIIGIALILAMSTGVQAYIDKVEEETLSSYPITLTSEAVDTSGLVEVLSGDMEVNASEREPDRIYSGEMMTKLLTTFMSEVKENDLEAFKKQIENDEYLKNLVSGVSYSYPIDLQIWSLMGDAPLQVNPSETFSAFMGADMPVEMNAYMGNMTEMSAAYGTSNNMNVFSELLDNPALLRSQYDLVAGKWPEQMNEIVLIVNRENTISDYTLYSLGLRPQSELNNMFASLMSGVKVDIPAKSFSFDEVLDMSFRLALPTDYYVKSDDGETWKNVKKNPDALYQVLSNSMELKIVGILRPAEKSIVGSSTGKIGYLPELTRYVIEAINSSEIVVKQLADTENDVISGLPFSKTAFSIDMLDLSGSEPVVNAILGLVGKDTVNNIVRQVVPTYGASTTYEENLVKFGVCNLDIPSAINIYPKSFESKQKLTAYIEEYNARMEAEGKSGSKIIYTDYVSLLLSGVTDIINAVTYVLVAFVAVSLIVSSIMIGVITYISVLERTKEIGILRALGASKRDISRVFNAETLIIGFAAGFIGIVVSNLLIIPINIVIENLSGIAGMAVLPARSAIILVAISMLLTLIAGLIPSRFAAKRDPVVALRSE